MMTTSDLDQLAVSRILGSTFQSYPRTIFGGFSAVKAVGEMLATRPKRGQRLAADASRDAKIVEAFSATHEGYSVDRLLADPALDITELDRRWQFVGTIGSISIENVPNKAGIFAISEPDRYLFLTRHSNMREGAQRFHDQALLDAIGNRFWKPSPESISLQLIPREDAAGITLRLLELKAIETYRPIFNLLPVAA
jgi:hypothetical protein